MASTLDDSTKQALKKIPLLKHNAGPRDGDLWIERLKEEYEALIAYINNNKAADSDWFRLESNADGTKWFGKCWYYHKMIKYEFDVEFDIPIAYPKTAPEIALPKLDGKTAKMYRGGRICLSDHFKPLWARNVPKFGIAHAFSLGLAPWLAVEIPNLIERGAYDWTKSRNWVRSSSFMSSSLSSDLSQDGASKRKALLTRSNAMCGDDDTRLRPSDQLGNDTTASGSRTKRYSITSSMSRDSSHADYTDSTGIDLVQFIANTLHKNAKDREMLLSLESEMRKFVLDKSRQVYKFPKMSSYNRMLVHRVAAFFGLDHNIDQTGTVVVVNKTPNTRSPDLEFSKCIKNNIFTDRILSRRNVQSFDECQLNQMYANIPAVHPNIVYGSAAATMPAVGMAVPSLPPSLDMIRRARSFEVGEWNNSMASSGVGCGSATALLPAKSTSVLSSAYLNSSGAGGGSSNSSSSWQLTNVPYASPRPDSIVSPAGGIMLDPNAYYAHSLSLTNNAQELQSGTANVEYSSPSFPHHYHGRTLPNRQCNQEAVISNDSAVVPDRAIANGAIPNAAPIFMAATPGAENVPVAGNMAEYASIIYNANASYPAHQPQYVNAAALYTVQQPQTVYYVRGGAATIPSQPPTAGNVPRYDCAGGASAAQQYYIAQYASPNSFSSTGTIAKNPTVDDTHKLAQQLQQGMQISNDDKGNCGNNVNSNSNNTPHVIPYNTLGGVCYITVGCRPTANAQVPVIAAQHQNVPLQQQQTTTNKNQLQQQTLNECSSETMSTSLANKTVPENLTG